MSLEFQRENTVFETSGRCAYFSLLQIPGTKEIRIYYRSSYPKEESGWASPTRYLESNDGITFSQPKNDIIFQNTGVCHNFFPFLDTNPQLTKNKQYKGLGGTHWKTKDPFWHLRDRHKNMKKNTAATHGYRGLYAFESADALKWNQIQEEPILNRKHPGFSTRRKQPSEFDSAICAMYDEKINKYRLWVRANVKRGIRYIQYTQSKDLTHWDEFKLIEMKPEFDNQSNYYMPSFYKHPDNRRYLGILPHCDYKKAALKLFISNDGIKWRQVKDLLTETPVLIGRYKKPKNVCHSVTGCVISKNKTEVYFYVHQNYFNYKKHRPVKIVRYSMPMDDIMNISS